MRFLYLILVGFAAPVAAMIALVRNWRDGSRRERLRDRFGRPGLKLRAPVIWVHAASMGEVQAAVPLVQRLMVRYASWQIVITTMTVTGAARVRAHFAERVTHCYLPYDLPFAVGGFLDRIRPKFAIILETELWPNLLRACRRRTIPVYLASARISPRTAQRYRILSTLFRDVIEDIDIAAQTTADAERFAALGARRVTVGGNFKFDIDIAASARQAGAALRAAIGQRFLWVAGSTHPGEEVAVLAAHRELLKQRSDALLVIAPRRPERFGEVRALVERSGLAFITRSGGASIEPHTAVLLLDTTGELLNYYAAADLAFVGGSLAPVGGHNLLEPAAFGVATLCGPHVQNAREVFDRLVQAGGVVPVASAEHLCAEVNRLAADLDGRRRIGTAALTVVTDNRGAVERFVATLP